MRQLLQHIEEMRVRLSEIASGEQPLVQALGDALNRLDQQLLRGDDHRARAAPRGDPRELQRLAGDIDMFRQPLGAQQAPEELPPYRRANDSRCASLLGDWRQATVGAEDLD